jgi:hypothetical protein
MGYTKLVEIQRLAYEVIRAQLDRRLYVIELQISSHHDHGAKVSGVLQLLQYFQPVLIGQADIKQNQVRRFRTH